MTGGAVSGDLSKLSVAEIRDQLNANGRPPSSQLLSQLKRDPRQGVRRLYAIARKQIDRERDERRRIDAMLNFERILWRSGIERVAGVDEAGMGPLAGPVVAAAVVFRPNVDLVGVDDSKRLDTKQRETLASEIRHSAAGIGIGIVDVDEIDRVNVYQAGLLAMKRAVEALPVPPEHVLVDARTIPDLAMPQNPFNRGDGIDFSIAAASIIAKTHRDALMEDLDRRFPGYGFTRHKGYGTPEHQEAIRRLGPSPVHRLSFGVIDELAGRYPAEFYALKDTLDACDGPGPLADIEMRIESSKSRLGEAGHRKLKLLIARRWQAFA